FDGPSSRWMRMHIFDGLTLRAGLQDAVALERFGGRHAFRELGTDHIFAADFLLGCFQRLFGDRERNNDDTVVIRQNQVAGEDSDVTAQDRNLMAGYLDPAQAIRGMNAATESGKPHADDGLG